MTQSEKTFEWELHEWGMPVQNCLQFITTIKYMILFEWQDLRSSLQVYWMHTDPSGTERLIGEMTIKPTVKWWYLPLRRFKDFQFTFRQNKWTSVVYTAVMNKERCKALGI